LHEHHRLIKYAV
jgi:hypothetical protein